jgi:hypothetical protein
MLHRQPSSKDQARKSWGPILGLRYFGPAKVVKERIGGGAEFVAFDCTSVRPGVDRSDRRGDRIPRSHHTKV